MEEWPPPRTWATAVQMRMPPKTQKTQLNCSMAAAPTTMKTVRRASATAMPISSTFCWYSRGTAKLDMMMTKTKRLSTLSAFSVMYPAKYSPAYCGPEKASTRSPKTTAMPT